MTSGPPDVTDPATRRTPRGPRGLAALAAGGVFLLSGAALVVYIVTGAPLWMVLALLVLLGAVLVGATLWPDEPMRRRWLARIRVGVPVGIVATVAYDLSRWVLVELLDFHASPFKAFPLFGQALVPAAGQGAAQLGIGIAFHLLNGTAFGCAYAIWFGHRPWWWGIGFALGLEVFMLAIYPGWLDIRTLEEFTTMSVLGHVVYGAVLGLGTRWLLARQARPDPVAPG